MKTKIQLKSQSQAVEYRDVVNCYEKGSFYCIYMSNGFVHKYPIVDIWRVEEEYVSIPPSRD